MTDNIDTNTAAAKAMSERLRSQTAIPSRNEVAEFVDGLLARAEKADAALAERDKRMRDEVLEEAALVAAKEGVYPELSVYGGGPDWYKHGKRIAAAIRAMKGGE